MKKVLLVSAAAIAMASGAQAADLGVARAPVAAVIAVPMFNWTGLYLGGHVGYGWTRSNWDSLPIGANAFARPDGNGFFGGLQLGYNHQINNIVLGVEADVSVSDLKGSSLWSNPLFGANYRSNVFGSLRARVGVAADRALFYVTGGLGLSDYRARTITCCTGYSTTLAGYAVGGGVEYAFTPNWTAKAEYLYYGFGSRTAAAGALDGPATRTQTSFHTVKLGLNYLFSTGPSAVVARY